MKQKISIHLVTWNGEKYIPYLFDSLKKQTNKNFLLYIWDNASTDETVKKMLHELDAKMPKKENKDIEFDPKKDEWFTEGNNHGIKWKFYKSNKNKGFAGGHNDLFNSTKNDYFVFLNQDMYLDKDCIQNLFLFMEKNNDVAVVSPRLMRWDFDLVKNDLKKSFTTNIDSLGLKIFRNRRVVEQYTQESWNKIKKEFQNKNALAVFGVSGTLPFFRRSALEKVLYKTKQNKQILDESYHSYKEDVDLAYRLQGMGYKAFTVLDAVAYHDRSAAGPKHMSDTAAAKNKKEQSSWVKYHSYKNHLRTLYKNEYWQNFILDLPWILWYELKKLFWFILFDRSVLKGLKEIFCTRKDIFQKRKYIVNNKKVSWKEFRKFWTSNK